MNIGLLNKILRDGPKYRYKQTAKAVFSDLINDWSQATNLPLDLRERLNKECSLFISGEVYKSKDNKTVKVVITLTDGLKIETVLMRHKDGRNSLCLSSQVGCPMGCGFCATGAMGFKRNLTADEIVDQYLFLARYLKNNFSENNKITNIVFMGMGEPFLNYDNVLTSIKMFNDKDLIGLGARHISVSTAGIVPGIKKLAKEDLQVNLAVSLHACDDALRSELMPVNRKYPLKDLFKAIDYYIDKTSRRVMFEYLMIKGVNDSLDQAKRLAGFMRKSLYFINLIPYNPTGNFKPAEEADIEKFKNTLEKAGVAVTRRHSFGQDISAACGQLAGK